MIVNEISLWGAALVAILVVIAMIALAFVDSCGAAGLQDICLVGLSALVSADLVLVDLLGSVSYQFHVEEGADTSKCCDAGG